MCWRGLGVAIAMKQGAAQCAGFLCVVLSGHATAVAMWCPLRAVCDKRTWSGLWLHWWPCSCPVTLPVHQHVQANNATKPGTLTLFSRTQTTAPYLVHKHYRVLHACGVVQDA